MHKQSAIDAKTVAAQRAASQLEEAHASVADLAGQQSVLQAGMEAAQQQVLPCYVWEKELWVCSNDSVMNCDVFYPSSGTCTCEKSNQDSYCCPGASLQCV
jgi:hypothetical protein